MAKIIGNTTATPNPRPDWLQNDEKKADYIKNKPDVIVHSDIDNELNLESNNPVQNSVITQRFNELDESLKEYVDDQNSKQDEKFGEFETLVTETMKTTVIDETSTDDQYSTAKATYDFVKAETASLVESAPETLDTLNELAAALGDDPNFATTVAGQIGEKASKEELNTAVSTINSKIDTLTSEKNTDVETINTELNTINTNINGINSSITEINNVLEDKSNKDHTHEVVTTEVDGYMSTLDKEKLDNIEVGANKTIIDSEFSDTSTNPVENKVVNNALSNINDQIETLDTQTNEKTNAINSSIEEINSKLTTTSENITIINNNITTLGGEVNTNTEEINNINTRIDNIENTGVSIALDSEMSETSTNPVQNKVITAAIAEVQNSADSALTDSKAYTDTKIADLINSAPTTLDTLGEIATAMEENANVVEALDTAIGTKANTSDLTSHTGNKNNPHGVSLSQLGVTATAAELNTLDGITATTTELNYIDGVTSNIQTQLDNKASAGFHKAWSCVTTVGSYSKLCRISGYSNFIMKINLNQSNQVSNFTLLIGTGYESASVTCLGGSNYSSNSNQIVRLTRQSSMVFDVEFYNTYGYNSATSVTVSCNILAPNSDINVTTYTSYTATSGTSMSSCTCRPSGIVAPTFYGALSGNADTATKLATARTIALTGSVTGSGSFDGSGNLSITTTTNHTHNSIMSQDTRAVNTTPANTPQGLSVHLKQSNIDGIDEGGNYHPVLMMKPWNDYSGGPYGQLSITGASNLYFRTSTSDSAWGAWKKVSIDGHTHSYLPLSGGTLTGALTANGKITVPTIASSWISGMTLSNAALAISTQQTADSYHPVLAVKTSSSHVVNIGGLGDSFGFYGFKSGRTANATDWQFTFNASTGGVAEGCNCVASGSCSHAEGYGCTASGDRSHAEGNSNATELYAHSQGCMTTASSRYSHSGGYKTTASGESSQAWGNSSIASGNNSYAGGYAGLTNGFAGFAHGAYVTSQGNSQAVFGKCNTLVAGPTNTNDTTGSLFIVGRGTSDTARANAFRITTAGQCMGTTSFAASGADYSEYYEWEDGNPNNEDRRGLFVTFSEGKKIRIANFEDDYILGVISADPSVIGNAYTDNWQGMHLTDVFGERLTEIVEVEEEEILDEEGNVIETIPAHTETHFILNPDYDSEKEYIGRNERQEWVTVGTHGQLVVIDDGSCQVNKYCKVSDNGIAIHSDEKTEYRIVERLDDTHIRIVIK